MLGPLVMQALRNGIRNCPEPYEHSEAGHFVQEWGEEIARRALSSFDKQRVSIVLNASSKLKMVLIINQALPPLGMLSRTTDVHRTNHWRGRENACAFHASQFHVGLK